MKKWIRLGAQRKGNPMYYYLIALIAGMALTIQIGVNGKLLASLQSPVLTSFVSFLVGTIALAISYILTVYNGMQPMLTLAAITQTNGWMWLGGLCGAFYIFTAILCSPKIGFANMFSLVVGGQIILAVIFDHFGLLGSPIHIMGLSRLAGVVLLIISVYLIQSN